MHLISSYIVSLYTLISSFLFFSPLLSSSNRSLSISNPISMCSHSLYLSFISCYNLAILPLFSSIVSIFSFIIART